MAWLRERVEVLTFDGDPVRTDVGAGCVYFLDAAGNVVELIASPHVEGEGGDFGPGSLIEIAEIGIAAADVDATARRCGSSSARVLWGAGPTPSSPPSATTTRW